MFGLIKRPAKCCTCEGRVRPYRPVLPYIEIELNRIVYRHLSCNETAQERPAEASALEKK